MSDADWDADDFEPVVKPAGPPKAFQDKWEGEDEDDDVKVSVFLEGHFQNFKLQAKFLTFLRKDPNLLVHFSSVDFGHTI